VISGPNRPKSGSSNTDFDNSKYKKCLYIDILTD
jgi:hypothetical protein